MAQAVSTLASSTSSTSSTSNKYNRLVLVLVVVVGKFLARLQANRTATRHSLGTRAASSAARSLAL